MTLGGSAAVALLAAIGRPRWWLLALAAFLMRGGIVLVVLPIITLPTQAGMANLLGPVLVEFVFGGPSPELIRLTGLGAAAALAWLIVGGLAATAMEIRVIREIAGARSRPTASLAWADSGAADPSPESPGVVSGLVARGLVARLVAHVPTAIAVVWAALPTIAATYAELVDPGDAAIPIVIRVALRVPGAVAVVAVCWLAGETAGGLAVRELVLGKSSLPRSLVRGARTLVRRPGTLPVAALRAVVVLGATVAAGVAATCTWIGVRFMLVGAQPVALIATLLVFAATWVAGLWLVGFAASWRVAAATLDLDRGRPD